MSIKNKFVAKCLLLTSTLALSGCDDWVVMSPFGDIAKQEAFLINASTVLMLVIVVPVLLMTVWFAWKYRASNKDATYEPGWHHSATLETVIWTTPLIIILVLSGLTYVATHRLDPYLPISRISEDKPLPDNVDTLVIEVVALDWKWLFIYPEYNIATVNEIAAPIDRPIQFKITSGSVMNSFYIPALAGQIYAMSGMETKMHAVINEKGVFDGFSANYSGHGFSQMHFKFHGVNDEGFDSWVSKVRSLDNQTLNHQGYLKLEEKTTGHPVTYFSTVGDNLYHDILNRCVDANTVCMDKQMHLDKHRAKNAVKHKE
ncbi:MAG: ubiquinol oxidase subunit II [Cycloclasticus sp.]